MAFHVTTVASPSLTVPAASVRRPAAARTKAGQPAAKAATAVLTPQVPSSFDSLMASSLSAKRPAAAIVAKVGKRPAATSTAASSAAAEPTGTATPASSTAGASGLSDFELLFGGSSYNPANPMVAPAAPSTSSANAAKAAPPTAESVFGPNVWMTDPIGLTPDGSSFGYNPFYFATQSTAQTVAQMVGGTVVAKNMFTQPGNAFVQQQPNYMVQMPNGALINPGLVASFYTLGFPQSQINTMIGQEVANTPSPAQTT